MNLESGSSLSAWHYMASDVPGLPGFFDIYIIDYGDPEEPRPSHVTVFPSAAGLPAYLYEFPQCPEGVPHAEVIQEALRAYLTLHSNHVRAVRNRVPSLS